jgi:hypothetical protein
MPVVIRMNSAEELSGMMTGALLLLALCAGALPLILSKWRNFRQTGIPKSQTSAIA